MTSLRVRSRAEEQMDDPALAPEVYDRVLRDLGRVNSWTFAARPTLAFLNRALKGRTAFRLLDVGFGEGGMLRIIARWAERRGIAADLVGVDLNPKSAAAAQALTPAGAPIRYVTGDYAGLGRFDLVVSSLVAHHMGETELIAFLRWMEENGGTGWLVNDLHRHAFAHAGYPLLARLLRVHRIVREDGQLSIARSFRPSDWAEILGAAAIPHGAAQVRRYFPFRLCVERLR
jgi:SAM-dependent methyltransferase